MSLSSQKFVTFVMIILQVGQCGIQVGAALATSESADGHAFVAIDTERKVGSAVACERIILGGGGRGNNWAAGK